MPVKEDGRKRVVIEGVDPEIDAGRFPIKRVVEDRVQVEADIFADGHDHVAAWLLHRALPPGAKACGAGDWQRVRMQPLGNDRWRGEFTVTEVGRYAYTLAGVIDHFDTWRSDLKKRIAAGQDISVDLKNGALLLEQAATRARAAKDTHRLQVWAKELRAGGAAAATLALDDELAELMGDLPDETLMSRYERELMVTVDRKRAQFSSWYELFPRSTAQEPGQHGTFKDVEARLEYVAGLGFDVLYLPPVHPIGESFRKGKNNSVTAEDGDVGSPWAIGGAEGGHTEIHPALGRLEDFGRLRAKAENLGLELALDIAFQCSPDHPWVKEHPAWFKHRADGTIQYAENPPKKYQDIYPLDFESEDWRGLWQGLKDVFLYWIGQGVKIFRVDNPHTKAFPFWEWCIGGLKAEYPEVLFLAEAFTRPRVMQRLAKLGFSQSYTYFTWRNTKEELAAYVTELTRTRVREYLRPNFWPNTPDILPEQLQIGGLPAFKSRLVLAATLASNFGVYGPAYEAAENAPLRKGGEEYLHSEKYQVRHWDWDAERPLSQLMQRLNRARRELPALQTMENLVFHSTDNPYLIAYSKRVEEDEHPVLTVVNLDPAYTQSGWVMLNMEALGMTDDERFGVFDLLTDAAFLWQGARNYVELSPELMPAHVFRVRKHVRTEKDFDYYL
ncbi:MAG: alpha-1,4-glucan--maltose-1-phosphate maltosyltransferase [Acidobacteriaceae bacterium]